VQSKTISSARDNFSFAPDFFKSIRQDAAEERRAVRRPQFIYVLGGAGFSSVSLRQSLHEAREIDRLVGHSF